MKNILTKMMLIMLLVSSYNASASFITTGDISSSSISLPIGWTHLNFEALFDGHTAQKGPKTNRFVGLRGSGAALNSTNTIDFSIDLSNAVTINSIALFNDWGSILNQQITDLSVDFLSGGSVVSSFLFTSLNQNTFAKIELASALSIANVDSIEFAISGVQATNIEITEIQIGASTNPVSASVPALGSLLALFIGFVLVRRNRV
ncbi:hypothetical protein [Agaribacter marinus]|uniref:PEP-CTERM sorting domain-containing protein n=1 Tax=Agaribacter marinus TaxID=1431249 RepID=A0AA37T0X9_9ALTE|nr:hypothetical protein [Agaribacter marinus]GLR72892.1 hypothetical protein GCM10007852_38000 [Agaribacter marinus]